MHLDERWARFLREEGFSVGLSMDGPAYLHDVYRMARWAATHQRVAAAFRLLKEQRVFCNILCVVHARNAVEPDRYRTISPSRRDVSPIPSLVAPLPGGGVSAATASADIIASFSAASSTGG